jgi:hypothetical protein
MMLLVSPPAGSMLTQTGLIFPLVVAWFTGVIARLRCRMLHRSIADGWNFLDLPSTRAWYPSQRTELTSGSRRLWLAIDLMRREQLRATVRLRRIDVHLAVLRVAIALGLISGW